MKENKSFLKGKYKPALNLPILLLFLIEGTHAGRGGSGLQRIMRIMFAQRHKLERGEGVDDIFCALAKMLGQDLLPLYLSAWLTGEKLTR